MSVEAFSPAVHEVAELEFTRHLRRRFACDDIFTFKHRRTGNWMVAGWHKSRRQFTNLFCLGRERARTMECVQFLESVVRGSPRCEQTARANREWLQGYERRMLLDDVARDAEQADIMQWCRAQTNMVRRDDPGWAPWLGLKRPRGVRIAT